MEINYNMHLPLHVGTDPLQLPLKVQACVGDPFKKKP